MQAPHFSFPGKALAQGWQSVPTSDTDLSTTDTHIWQLVVVNNNAAGRTFTLKNKDGGVVAPFNAWPLEATGSPNAMLVFTPEKGVIMNGGITWSASGSDVVAQIKATQAG